MGKEKKGIKMWAPVVLIRYGLAQGIHYMNVVERVHRLSIEGIVVAVLFFCLRPTFPVLWQAIAVSLLGAHGLNMMFNGHLWALIKHDLYWFGWYNGWTDFADYVERVQQRLHERPCKGLALAEVYGSITRGKFSECSDLDMRFIAKPGWMNGIRTCNRVAEERLRAFLSGFPMDLYMFRDKNETAKKMNVEKETPLVLFCSGQSNYQCFRVLIDNRFKAGGAR
jgi:hypothetical protein